MDDTHSGAVFPFEEVGESLSLLPLAARRALDIAGFRLSLEAYQSLSFGDRKELARAGAEEQIDPNAVDRIVRRGQPPATRIKPVSDPDPLMPPEQLNLALGPRRGVTPAQWTKLRALERYALVHVMRRSIAHNDPGRLEAAAQAILPPKKVSGQKKAPQPARAPAPSPPDVGPATSRSEPPPSPVLPSLDLEVGRRDLERRDGERVDGQRIDGERPSARPMIAVAEPPAAPATARARIGLDAPFDSSPPRRAEVLQASEAPAGASPSSHVGPSGEVRMVDVGAKPVTHRRATATGLVRMRTDTATRLVRGDTPKGEVLATARVAGIMAAKRTSDLVPLCHPIALTRVEVLLDIEPALGLVTVSASAEAHDRTGVEMEALTAVSVSCLTVYDMLKGIDSDITIDGIRLVSKTGGKSGDGGRRD